MKKATFKQSRVKRGIPNLRNSAGFSLFELVVFIISVAIIYAYAANRFADFPGQAERANFLAVSTQLQSAIQLEMMLGLGGARSNSASILEGANPMDLVLEPPVNYIGAFDLVDSSRINRRVWYFDLGSEELVYLVNDTTGVFHVIDGADIPTDEIRFKLVANYNTYDKITGLPLTIVERGGVQVPSENKVSQFEGIVLRPVIPYKWGATEVGVLLAGANRQFPG